MSRRIDDGRVHTAGDDPDSCPCCCTRALIEILNGPAPATRRAQVWVNAQTQAYRIRHALSAASAWHESVDGVHSRKAR